MITQVNNIINDLEQAESRINESIENMVDLFTEQHKYQDVKPEILGDDENYCCICQDGLENHDAIQNFIYRQTNDFLDGDLEIPNIKNALLKRRELYTLPCCDQQLHMSCAKKYFQYNNECLLCKRFI